MNLSKGPKDGAARLDRDEQRQPAITTESEEMQMGGHGNFKRFGRTQTPTREPDAWGTIYNCVGVVKRHLSL